LSPWVEQEYYRPIITPYELILALDGEKGVARWDPEQWTLDFGRVLSGG
jgi:diphthamide synthase subunit DPH2